MGENTGENGEAPLELSEEATTIIYNLAKKENFKNIHLDITEASSKGDNYLGILMRVKITDSVSNKFITIIVKNAPPYKAMRDQTPIGLLYKREIFAYSTILPTLCGFQEQHQIPEKDKFKYAKYYDGILVDEKESLLIEDLRLSGFTLYNRQKPFDQQHLELVIKTMARYHALSFVLKKVNPELFEHFRANVASNIADYGINAEKMIDLCKDKCMEMIDDLELRRKANAFFGNSAYNTFGKYVNGEKPDPYYIICHGDCWNNNFMFKYEGDRVTDMRFVDWQIIRYASPITDIAYSFFSSTDETMRASHYTNILDLYYETLSNNVALMGCKIAECYPKNVYEDQIKTYMPYGLASATLLLPIILANKEDAPDTSIDPTELGDTIYDNLMTERCKNRYSGVVRDSHAYGFF